VKDRFAIYVNRDRICKTLQTLQTSQYFLSLWSLAFAVAHNRMPRLTTISRVTCVESQFAEV